MRANSRWLCALACVLAAGSWARGEAPLADKVPAGAMAYAGWSGKTAALEGSAAWELLNGPGAAEALRAAKEAMVSGAGAKDRPAVEHARALAEMAFGHRAAGALLDVDLGEGARGVKACVLVELGKDREAFAGHVDGLIRWAVENGHVTATKASANGVSGLQLRFRDEAAPPLAVGYMGDTFFLTVGAGVPASLIGLPPGKSLRADKAFQAAHKAVEGRDELATFYVDVAAVAGRLKALAASRPATGPAGEGIMEALGLAGVKSLAGSVSVVDRQLLLQGRLVSPAPHRGVLMPLAGAPLTDAALSHVPADAYFAAAVNLSPADYYAELRRIARAFSPKADREFQEAEGKTLGASLTRDLLPALGDTWVLASAPSWGGAFTGTLLTVQVKDAAKAAAALEKIETHLARKFAGPASAPGEPDAPPRSGFTLETRRAGGAAIRFVAARGKPVPVAPAWAIHRGRLYVGLWPQVIESAIVRKSAAPLPASEAFAALKGRIGRGAGAMVYLNGAAMTRDVYNLLLIGGTMGAGVLQEAGPRLRADWLPALAVLEECLPPEMAAVVPDAEGITLRGSPSLVGLSAGVAFVAGAVAAYFVAPSSPPTVDSPVGGGRGTRRVGLASEAARASALAGDLAVLRNAIDMYAAEHDRAYPRAATFTRQMTQYTSAAGAVSARKDAAHPYGPYLQTVPALPVGARKGASWAEGADGPKVGWIYNEKTGAIRANTADTERDLDGKPYNTY